MKMRKNRNFSLLAVYGLLVTVLAGCARTVPVVLQMQKAARADISGIKRIAVVDFKNYPLHPNSGEKAANALISQLLPEKYYQVLERDRMNQILKEHALALSGIIDPDTAQEVGNILGVDALVFGSVSAYTVETTRGTENVTRKVGTGKYRNVERKNIFTGKKYMAREEIMKTVIVPREYIVKKATVGLDFRMVNVQTGVIIASISKSASYNQKATSSYQIARLPADEKLLADLTNQTVKKFVVEISPHYVTQTRYLEKGKDKTTQLGVTYAQGGLWEEAVEQWKLAISADPSNAPAHHNLGIAYERENKYAKALTEYKKALSLQPTNKRYIQSVNDIRNRIEEAKKLEAE